MKRIPCQGGQFVEVLEDNQWLVPMGVGPFTRRYKVDLTRLPVDVRDWWRTVFTEAFRMDSLAQVRGIWHTALWFYRFHKATSRVPTVRWDEWQRVDWGAYAHWLNEQQGIRGRRPLSLDYRRGQFGWLAAAAQHAIDVGLLGTSDVTISRLKSVSSRVFRGTQDVSNQRLVQRALSHEQWDELDRILSEEWFALQDPGRTLDPPFRLSVVVAAWLTFHHGVRSAEINRLTVDDILPDADGRHHLRVHAPNKAEDLIPIDAMTLHMLEVLVDVGAECRADLGTRHLFVGRRRGPRILGTTANPAQSLTWGLRDLIQRYEAVELPSTITFPDGRLTFGTHLAYDIGNREKVRQIMRHENASTTERFYRAPDKLRVAKDISSAIRSEAVRLTMACQQPVMSVEERPDHQEVLARNPENAQLEYGSCGLDVQRQGTCRMAVHCFECPLLVPWVSKRHNFVYERDVYEKKAAEAANDRDRENYLRHAALAEAHILLIDRRKEGPSGPIAPTRSRRPRR